MAMAAGIGMKTDICTCIFQRKIRANTSSGLKDDSSRRTTLQERGGFEAVCSF